MVQFAEDDRENEPLENQQLRCATSSSGRPVRFASHLSKAPPLSEVGFIFKLQNILTACFGDYSMKMVGCTVSTTMTHLMERKKY